MIKYLVKMLQALSSNTAPAQIAHAVSCGFILGFVPKESLLWYILFVFILFLRIQRGTYALFILVGALLAPFLDPLFNDVGYWILTQPSLTPVFQSLLDIPFVAFTRINNTVVLGSLVCGIAAYIPLWLVSRLFIFVWRKYIAASARRWKFVKVLKQIPLIEKIVEAVTEGM